MEKGLFIAIEGMDGSGSTTQCKKLINFLNASGRKAVLTAEPSSNDSGVLLRKYLDAARVGGETVSKECLALLFAADRLFHYDNDIAPKLAEGMWVVSDRYVLSSLVYQGMDLELEWVSSINRFAPAPDLTIVLSVDDQVAADRRNARRGKVEIYDELATQKVIRRRYQDLSPSVKAQLVDGNGNEDEVFEHLKLTLASL